VKVILLLYNIFILLKHQKRSNCIQINLLNLTNFSNIINKFKYESVNFKVKIINHLKKDLKNPSSLLSIFSKLQFIYFLNFLLILILTVFLHKKVIKYHKINQSISFQQNK
jgi:hypothetical protein